MRAGAARPLLSSMLLCGLVLLTPSTPAQENGELGRLWTFEDPPLAELEARHGFTPDRAWLDALRLGTLRLGGETFLSELGSASFVSPEGLILTSHAAVRHAVAMTLDADGHTRHDDPPTIIETGFVAATREREIRLRARRDAWLTAEQLVRITDVTGEVDSGVTPKDTERQRKAKRDANEQAILDAARAAEPELAPQLVSLHGGAVVRLYQFRVYDDIRLVVLPHLRSAHFGRELDDLTWPRHALDFAFLRAYENGTPADTTRHHFAWATGGAKQGEPVFVSGSPGTTRRLLTAAQSELEREIRVPMEIERLADLLHVSKSTLTFHWQVFVTGIFRLEQRLEATRGVLRGLEDPTTAARKAAAEEAFMVRVASDPELARRYGDLWDRMAGVARERRLHEARARFHTAGGLGLVEMAMTIVRSHDPAESEDGRERARREIESWGTSGGGIPNGAYRETIANHITRARRWLPEDGPYLSKVLGGRTGGEYLEAVVGPGNAGHRDGPEIVTLVHHPERRDALLEGGWDAIRTSEDAAISIARELVVLMRENETLGSELDAREAALGAELGRALLASYGTTVGSDGTGTPRFSDGVVAGVTSNGTTVPHRTTFHGIYGRNAAFDDETPFDLPPIWLDRKDAIDMTTPVAFASTNDVTVGSSGSVVVNEALEVVGVVAGGNRESLHNEFVFSDDRARTVSVHVDGITEALVTIYDAGHVVAELTGEAASPALRAPVISADGAWMAAETSDGTIRVWSTESDRTHTIDGARQPRFSPDSRWVSALRMPADGTTDAGRTLVLLDTRDGSRRTFDSVLSHEITRHSSYLAYLRATKGAGEDAGTLHVVELESERTFTWENVRRYAALQRTTDHYAYVAFVTPDAETGRDELEIAVVGYQKRGWGTRGSHDGGTITDLAWARDSVTLQFLDTTPTRRALYTWNDEPRRPQAPVFTRVNVTPPSTPSSARP